MTASPLPRPADRNRVQRGQKARAAIQEGRPYDRDNPDALVHEDCDEQTSSDLIRNGERQLHLLTLDELQALGTLLTVGVMKANKHLREGREHLWGKDNSYFARLGDDLRLDTPMRLFRGIGVPRRRNGRRPGAADIMGYLSGETSPAVFPDRGFGFATPSLAAAKGYAEKAFSTSEDLSPTIIEINATSGLCVPHLAHRSDELFEKTYDVNSYLDTAVCQVVFGPGSQWKVTDIQIYSHHQAPRLCLQQISK